MIKAIDFMRQNLEAPLTCQELADASNMSARQMERLFKQHLQLSPGQYYLHLRLENTQQLLRQSSLSVLQIATACGFSSTSYLVRCYQKNIAVHQGKSGRVIVIVSYGWSGQNMHCYSVFSV